jgi:hypothetical protein
MTSLKVSYASEAGSHQEDVLSAAGFVNKSQTQQAYTWLLATLTSGNFRKSVFKFYFQCWADCNR